MDPVHPHRKNGCRERQPQGFDYIGRDGEIRTRDLTHPKRARYQAAPRPVKLISSMAVRLSLSNAARLFFPRFRPELLQFSIALVKQIQNIAKLTGDALE